MITHTTKFSCWDSFLILQPIASRVKAHASFLKIYHFARNFDFDSNPMLFTHLKQLNFILVMNVVRFQLFIDVQVMKYSALNHSLLVLNFKKLKFLVVVFSQII